MFRDIKVKKKVEETKRRKGIVEEYRNFVERMINLIRTIYGKEKEQRTNLYSQICA
jgi:hypothetical protein